MLRTIFLIRIKQIFRLLIQIGLIRAIFVLGLLFFLLLGIVNFTISGKYSVGILLLILTLVSSIHFGRSDKAFLSGIFPKVWFIFFIEYFILVLPLLLTFLLTETFYFSILIFVFILCISFIQLTFKLYHKSFNRITILNPVSFEWINGIRKNIPIIAGMQILCIFLYDFIPIQLITILVFGIICSSFNTFAESKEMLIVFGAKPVKILFRKFKNQIFYFFLLCLPQLLFLILNEWQSIFLGFLALIIATITIFFSIVLKYSLFIPNENLNNNMIFNFLICFFCFVPFLFPIVLFMIVKYFQKSLRNLQMYIN